MNVLHTIDGDNLTSRKEFISIPYHRYQSFTVFTMHIGACSLPIDRGSNQAWGPPTCNWREY